MAKPGEYTRARYAAMQGVMWLVLLGAVGLASLVDQTIIPSARNLALGPVQSYGGVHFRLPATWDISPNPRDFYPVARAVAQEPEATATQFAPRKLIVYCVHLRQLSSAADYFTNSGMGSVIFGNVDVRAKDASLDGNRAVEIDGTFQMQTDDGPAIESDLVICSVFPNHMAVTLQLQKPGLLNLGDKALFDAVAKAIHVDR